MKTLKKSILLLTSLAVMSLASCVNDGLTEGPAAGAGKVAALDEQAASIEATVEDLKALQSAAEGNETALDEAVNALETHIADLRSGASLMEGTMATFAMQKKIAGVIGAIEVSDEEGAFKRQISNLEKGISSWVGKNFDAYYPAAKAEAVAAARLAGLDLKTQKIRVEAILSDVEAGLRKIADKDELTGLASAVNGNMESAEELVASLSAIAAEVEAEYAQAVETAVTDPDKFDLPALKQFNSGVVSTLSEADNTLAGLIARVKACEAQLDDIKARLASLESKVDDLEELLGMIQSVIFMSEYSTENAVAYYNLGTDSRADGKKTRTPAASINLNYIVRPATAAEALAASDLWDNQMKVIGYYAGRIEQSAVSMFDFDITGVEADATTGIVTVTVSSNALDENFYFKETGAKLALSIATGKTDLTSKFVEIIPVDESGRTYVESVSLDKTYVEVDDGQTAQLNVTVSPSGAYDKSVVWNTDNAGIVSVSNTGQLTANSVGTATITATTNGTDEWGNKLTATCTVNVNPNIKIVGPTYVELGGNIELRVESPDYIADENVAWSLADPSTVGFVTFEETGVTTEVSAMSINYNATDGRYSPIYINCAVNGMTLTHELYVVEIQPKGLLWNSLDEIGTTNLKIGSTLSMAASINPTTVKSDLFKVVYSTQGGNVESIAKVDYTSGLVTAVGVGTLTFFADVTENQTNSYFYPAGNRIRKYLTVNVQPYYVESMSFPKSSYTIAPDATAKIAINWESDVPGHDPSFTDVIWSIDGDQDVISLNEETGEIKALKTGSVTLKATTTNENATADGNPKSATAKIVVEESIDPIYVGDYYYSDGTWSSTYNSSKTVIGVVFAVLDATTSDNKLNEDYPQSCHALAVGLTSYNTVWGYANTGNASGNGYLTTFNSDNGGCLSDLTVSNGYTNTSLLAQYSNAYGYQSDYSVYYAQMFRNDSNGIPYKHTANQQSAEVSHPVGASAWYIPSFYEMSLLSENATTVNASLEQAGGTKFNLYSYHYTSTFFTSSNKQYVGCYTPSLKAFNSVGMPYSSNYSYDVRVVLAF